MSDHVWIVDDDSSIRWVLQKALSQVGIITESFTTADAIYQQLDSRRPQAILCDIRMPGTSGLDLLASLHKHHPQIPVIIMTAHSDLDSAVASYQGGAFEYLPKPFDIDEAVTIVERALRHSRENSHQAAAQARHAVGKQRGVCGIGSHMGRDSDTGRRGQDRDSLIRRDARSCACRRAAPAGRRGAGPRAGWASAGLTRRRPGRPAPRPAPW